MGKRPKTDNEGPRDVFFVKGRGGNERNEALHVIRDIVRRELEIVNENMELDRRLTQINTNLGKIKHVLKGKLRLPVKGKHIEVDMENDLEANLVDSQSYSNPMSAAIDITSAGEVILSRKMESSLKKTKMYSDIFRSIDKTRTSSNQRRNADDALPVVVRLNTSKGVNIVISEERPVKLPSLSTRPGASKLTY